MSSIRRQLLAALLASVLIAGAVAAVAVYYTAQNEAGVLLDYQLRQMALSLRDQALHQGRPVSAPQFDNEFDFAIDIRSEDGSGVRYSRSRVDLPFTGHREHATVDTPSGSWRMYTLRDGGFTVRVAQPTYLRDDLAVSAALRTMMPFVLLVPMLALLVWAAVTRGLKPLESVANAVKSRGAESLRPLDETRVPQEIQPVVSSLNDLLARLTRALELQRAFVADAAHALRTPLTALNLQIQLAERAQSAQERAAAFSTLKDGVNRATHLVEQLLTLARHEPQPGDRSATEVDLAALAGEVVAAYAPLAESKDVDLGLDGDEAHVMVHGERESLRTLLANLIDNALRYTPSGGRIDASVSRDNGGAVFEVSDTGPGIRREDRERVFDRFYRAAGNDVPGSGLGLAIVRSIAERHDAKLVLGEGRDGRGLRVRVVFPPPPPILVPV
jgi:two-component system OmpR family sensor kinase